MVGTRVRCRPKSVVEQGRSPSVALVAASVASVFLVMLDNTAINLALPQIQHDLATSLSQLEWAVNAYVLTFASCMLGAADIAVRLGRRRVFMAGLALFGLASVGCGVAPDAAALIVAGAFQGAGAALLVPASLSLIARCGSARRRIDPVALWSAAVGGGLAGGPVVGGVLTSFVGWRAIFLVNVPIVIACLVAVRSNARPSARPLATASTRLSVVLSALALFALMFAVIDAPGNGGSCRLLGSVVIFVAAGGWFVARERRRPSVVDLSLFRSATFSAAAAGALVLGFALFGTLLFVSLLAQSLGRSPAVAGLMFAPLTVAMIAAAPAVHRLRRCRHATPARLAAGGMLLFGLALAVLSRLCDHLEPGATAGAFALAGIGVALSAESLTRLAIDAAPDHESDAASALTSTIRQIGGALGIGVMGLLVQTSAAPSTGGAPSSHTAYAAAVSTALVVAAGVVLVGAMAVGWLGTAERRPATV